ncbi:hypothetical protein NG99_21345 [Erwinia typographi]|uniref:Uncharacterized protein n=1 Tax=Erwinia typographi TaxID=371042 RepID=A0A0A3YNB2_9GAMM|nr:hypothetical protein [Erwinia typographi]KGT88307.1 hypothetical protein NG99_21345 [Erwinia typographi]
MSEEMLTAEDLFWAKKIIADSYITLNIERNGVPVYVHGSQCLPLTLPLLFWVLTESIEKKLVEMFGPDEGLIRTVGKFWQMLDMDALDDRKDNCLSETGVWAVDTSMESLAGFLATGQVPEPVIH